MKKILLGLVLAFTCTALGEIVGSPYEPLLDRRLHELETGTGLDASAITTDAIAAGAVTEPKLEAQTGESLYAARIARFEYDVATDLGTIAAHGLGVTLPAKAVIIRSYFRTDTQFVDAGSGTVALSCEDANNIKTATDITGNADGTFVEGQSTGAASAFVGSIAAACEITATVAGAAQTSGKLTGWVHYVIQD